MPLRATRVGNNPQTFFLQKNDEGPYLRVSDILLRYHHSHTHIFTDLIRFATHSKWSHSALIYLVPDPPQQYDKVYVVDATTDAGTHIETWENEIDPIEKYSDAIKRPCLDWYVETLDERSRHDLNDPEDVHGIEYLRQVRSIALGQLNGLYDHKVVWELTALYIERVAKRHLGAIPQIAEAAAGVAHLIGKWDEASSSKETVMRFICSGLIQYSFFEALRSNILHNLAIPENRDAALSNLSNMHHIIFRTDPDHVISQYVQQVQSGELDLAAPVPEDVVNLLKTATPADFNNSSDLEWRYVIFNGFVWQISDAPEGYQPGSKEEAEVLKLTLPEHSPFDEM
jgi:hypothetical protein